MPTRADAITREHLEHFLADEQSRPRRRTRGEATTIAPATVAGTYRSLQQLWRWLVDEGEATTNPFDRMKPPFDVTDLHVDNQHVAALATADLPDVAVDCTITVDGQEIAVDPGKKAVIGADGTVETGGGSLCVPHNQ